MIEGSTDEGTGDCCKKPGVPCLSMRFLTPSRDGFGRDRSEYAARARPLRATSVMSRLRELNDRCHGLDFGLERSSGVRIGFGSHGRILREIEFGKEAFQLTPIDVRVRQNLGQNVPDHTTVNVCQPALGTVVVVRELFMVQAEQVQNGGVKVVDVNHVLDGLVANG